MNRTEQKNMSRKTAAENRQHVLASASPLFYRQGIRAVGMDQIIKEAGVGNATVYRQFPTKDHLATAYVQERADAWFTRMRAAADAVEDPRGKILAVFEVTAGDIGGATYRGCPMLNTHTEFPDPTHPAHAVAVVHKLQVCDWFRDLAEDAGAANPQVLAEQLLLVLNGTLSTAAVLGADGPARQGLALAGQLIAAACD
jgi:AcrR family transcriptional regulator